MSSAATTATPPVSGGLKAPRENVVRRFVEGDLASLRVFIVLGLIWLVFQLENSHFLTAENLTNLFLQITAVGLISVGVVFVLLLGEIDLSVGAVSGLAAAVMAVLNVQHGWSPYTAIAAAIVAGVAIGALQGALFTRFGIPSFVVTLAGLLTWQGALLQVLGSTGTVNLTDPKITGLANTFYSDTVSWIIAIVVIVVYAGATLAAWRSRVSAGLADQDLRRPLVRVVLATAATVAVVLVFTSDRGLPLAVLILLAFVAGMEYCATRTRFGRHVFAVGGSAEAARRAGIHINAVRIAVFCDRRSDGGDRRHPRRVAAVRRQPELRRQRPPAAGDRRPRDRRDEPVRRARVGLDGPARCPRDRVDLQRHGPARARLVGQVHGDRRRPARRGDR